MESRPTRVARYDPDADALIIVLRPRGRLSHAEEEGSIVIHYDEDGRVLAIEILEASKMIPRLVEALAKRQAAILA